jgi:glycosyltransferase involved in cell wall biosynthesis
LEKLCIIYNTAPKYREGIFKLIDEEYDCDWYFGPTTTDIREMDVSILNRVVYYKTCGNANVCYWKRGILRLAFKRKYKLYLLLAESRSITDYVFIGIVRLFFPQKRIFIWTHGWYGKESNIERFFKLWQFHHVNGIFLYGNYAKKALLRLGIASQKLFVIHNSLDYTKHSDLRNTNLKSDIYMLHFDNNNPVILFIGRLTLVKRLDMLIEALALLKKHGRIYNVVYVGDGVICSDLQYLTEKMGIQDTTWFYGSCYDENINAKLIYNADLCVAPGNVGLTAVHSMTFGCPVISHDDFAKQMPEFEAIKPGITGDFFKKDSVDSLAICIDNWFSAKENHRHEVRNACFKEIDSFWNPNYQMNIIRDNLK